MRALALASVLQLALAPVGASAACRWQWACNRDGVCQDVPICDSAIDLAPPHQPSIQPIEPPSIAPIQRPVVPPIGTDHCAAQHVLGPGGWHWETLCE